MIKENNINTGEYKKNNLVKSGLGNDGFLVQAKINDEVYDNFKTLNDGLYGLKVISEDNYKKQDQEISKLNTSFNTLNSIESNDKKQNERLKELDNDIIEIKKTNYDKHKELEGVQFEIKNKSREHDDDIKELDRKLLEKDVQFNNHNSTIIDHDSKIGSLENKYKLFETNALDQLSKHFDIQAGKLDEKRQRWLDIVVTVFYTILFADIIIIGLIIYYEKIASNAHYIVIPNLLAFSFLYFAVSQYSSYKRLQLEYENRGVVSRSFFGILNQVKGDDSINTITRIVADTLFSRNVTDQGAELPIKEMSKVFDTISNNRK